MPVVITRGPQAHEDGAVREIAGALERYTTDHPGAVADLYRYGRYLIRIRVTDPCFVGRSRGERHKAVWEYLHALPEEAVSDISSVLLLTPDEKPGSFASMEFDDPVPVTL